MDINHPADAKFVIAHAEFVAPHLPFERHTNRTAFSKFGELIAKFFGVVGAKADAKAPRLSKLHTVWGVGADEGFAAAESKHGVHNMVLFARIVAGMKITKRVQLEFATEDALVKIKRFAGVVFEINVRG